MGVDNDRAFKHALRDLGVTARQAGLTFPEGQEVLTQIFSTEQTLRQLMQAAKAGDTTAQPKIDGLNRQRGLLYAQYGQLVTRHIEPSELPESVRSAFERVRAAVLSPKSPTPLSGTEKPSVPSEKPQASDEPPARQSTETRARRKWTLPIGIAGLALVLPAAIVRIWMVSNPGAGGFEKATDLQMYIGGGSAIVVLMGCILSLIGIVKKDGIVPAAIALLLALSAVAVQFVGISDSRAPEGEGGVLEGQVQNSSDLAAMKALGEKLRAYVLKELDSNNIPNAQNMAIVSVFFARELDGISGKGAGAPPVGEADSKGGKAESAMGLVDLDVVKNRIREMILNPDTPVEAVTESDYDSTLRWVLTDSEMRSIEDIRNRCGYWAALRMTLGRRTELKPEETEATADAKDGATPAESSDGKTSQGNGTKPVQQAVQEAGGPNPSLAPDTAKSTESAAKEGDGEGTISFPSYGVVLQVPDGWEVVRPSAMQTSTLVESDQRHADHYVKEQPELCCLIQKKGVEGVPPTICIIPGTEFISGTPQNGNLKGGTDLVAGVLASELAWLAACGTTPGKMSDQVSFVQKTLAGKAETATEIKGSGISLLGIGMQERWEGKFVLTIGLAAPPDMEDETTNVLDKMIGDIDAIVEKSAAVEEPQSPKPAESASEPTSSKAGGIPEATDSSQTGSDAATPPQTALPDADSAKDADASGPNKDILAAGRAKASELNKNPVFYVNGNIMESQVAIQNGGVALRENDMIVNAGTETAKLFEGRVTLEPGEWAISIDGHFQKQSGKLGAAPSQPAPADSTAANASQGAQAKPAEQSAAQPAAPENPPASNAGIPASLKSVPQSSAGDRYSRTGMMVNFGGQFRMVALFMSPTATQFPSPATSNGDKVGRAVARNWEVLAEKTKTAVNLSKETGGEVEGQATATLVHTVLIPMAGNTVGPPFDDKDVATCEPGTVTTIGQAVADFGQPDHMEPWANSTLKADTYWWGGVGLATSQDGNITHLLLKTFPGENRGEERASAPPKTETAAPTSSASGSAEPQAGETRTFAGIEMVWCPPGEFMMGSNDGDDDEKPVHKITLAGFWMGKYEVTQAQWQAVMNSNPSYFKGDARLPVEMVSWKDCQVFTQKLNMKGNGTFRLPTEAEWEYACRAGSNTEYCFGDNESGLGEYAWYRDNSGPTSHPVGQMKPNAWGFYDMHGNMLEWCDDCYDEQYYLKSPVSNPRNHSGENARVLRGGTWGFNGRICRSANRDRLSWTDADKVMGLRLARAEESTDAPGQAKGRQSTPAPGADSNPANKASSGGKSAKNGESTEPNTNAAASSKGAGKTWQTDVAVFRAKLSSVFEAIPPDQRSLDQWKDEKCLAPFRGKQVKWQLTFLGVSDSGELDFQERASERVRTRASFSGPTEEFVVLSFRPDPESMAQWKALSPGSSVRCQAVVSDIVAVYRMDRNQKPLGWGPVVSLTDVKITN